MLAISSYSSGVQRNAIVLLRLRAPFSHGILFAPQLGERVGDLRALGGEKVREQIEKSYAHTFGEQPPTAHNVLDSRLVEEGTVRAHTAALEQKVAVLQQELAQHAANETDEDDVPWVTGGSINIELHVPEERAASIRTGIVEGRKCLLVPIEDDEEACVNGKNLPL